MVIKKRAHKIAEIPKIVPVKLKEKELEVGLQSAQLEIAKLQKHSEGIHAPPSARIEAERTESLRERANELTISENARQQRFGRYALQALEEGKNRIAALAIAMGRLEGTASVSAPKEGARKYLPNYTLIHDIAASRITPPPALMDQFVTDVKVAYLNAENENLRVYSLPRKGRMKAQRSLVIKAAETIRQRLLKGDREAAGRLLNMALTYLDLLDEHGWKVRRIPGSDKLEAAIRAEIQGKNARELFDRGMIQYSFGIETQKFRASSKLWDKGLATQKAVVSGALDRVDKLAEQGNVKDANYLFTLTLWYIDLVGGLGERRKDRIVSISRENAGLIRGMEAALNAFAKGRVKIGEEKTERAFGKSHHFSQVAYAKRKMADIEKEVAKIKVGRETINKAITEAKRRIGVGDPGGAIVLLVAISEYLQRYDMVTGRKAAEVPDYAQGGRELLRAIENETGARTRAAHISAVELLDRATGRITNAKGLRDDFKRLQRKLDGEIAFIDELPETTGWIPLGERTEDGTFQDYITLDEIKEHDRILKRMEYVPRHVRIGPTLNDYMKKGGILEKAVESGDVKAYVEAKKAFVERIVTVAKSERWARALTEAGRTLVEAKSITKDLDRMYKDKPAEIIRRLYEKALELPEEVRTWYLDVRQDFLLEAGVFYEGRTGTEVLPGIEPAVKRAASLEKRRVALLEKIRKLAKTPGEFPAEEYRNFLRDLDIERKTSAVVATSLRHIQLTEGYFALTGEVHGAISSIARFELLTSRRCFEESATAVLRAHRRIFEEGFSRTSDDRFREGLKTAEDRFSRGVYYRSIALEVFSAKTSEMAGYEEKTGAPALAFYRDLQAEIFHGMLYGFKNKEVQEAAKQMQEAAWIYDHAIFTIPAAAKSQRWVLPKLVAAVFKDKGWNLLSDFTADQEKVRTSIKKAAEHFRAGAFAKGIGSLQDARKTWDRMRETVIANKMITTGALVVGGFGSGYVGGWLFTSAIFTTDALDIVVTEYSVKGYASAGSWGWLAFMLATMGMSGGAQFLRSVAQYKAGIGATNYASRLRGAAKAIDVTHRYLGAGFVGYMSYEATTALMHGDLPGAIMAGSMAFYPIFHMRVAPRWAAFRARKAARSRAMAEFEADLAEVIELPRPTPPKGPRGGLPQGTWDAAELLNPRSDGSLRNMLEGLVVPERAMAGETPAAQQALARRNAALERLERIRAEHPEVANVIEGMAENPAYRRFVETRRPTKELDAVWGMAESRIRRALPGEAVEAAEAVEARYQKVAGDEGVVAVGYAIPRTEAAPAPVAMAGRYLTRRGVEVPRGWERMPGEPRKQYRTRLTRAVKEARKEGTLPEGWEAKAGEKGKRHLERVMNEVESAEFKEEAKAAEEAKPEKRVEVIPGREQMLREVEGAIKDTLDLTMRTERVNVRMRELEAGYQKAAKLVDKLKRSKASPEEIAKAEIAQQAYDRARRSLSNIIERAPERLVEVMQSLHRTATDKRVSLEIAGETKKALHRIYARLYSERPKLRVKEAEAMVQRLEKTGASPTEIRGAERILEQARAEAEAQTTARELLEARAKTDPEIAKMLKTTRYAVRELNLGELYDMPIDADLVVRAVGTQAGLRVQAARELLALEQKGKTWKANRLRKKMAKKYPELATADLAELARIVDEGPLPRTLNLLGRRWSTAGRASVAAELDELVLKETKVVDSRELGAEMDSLIIRTQQQIEGRAAVAAEGLAPRENSILIAARDQLVKFAEKGGSIEEARLQTLKSDEVCRALEESYGKEVADRYRAKIAEPDITLDKLAEALPERVGGQVKGFMESIKTAEIAEDLSAIEFLRPKVERTRAAMEDRSIADLRLKGAKEEGKIRKFLKAYKSWMIDEPRLWRKAWRDGRAQGLTRREAAKLLWKERSRFYKTFASWVLIPGLTYEVIAWIKTGGYPGTHIYNYLASLFSEGRDPRVIRGRRLLREIAQLDIGEKEAIWVATRGEMFVSSMFVQPLNDEVQIKDQPRLRELIDKKENAQEIWFTRRNFNEVIQDGMQMDDMLDDVNSHLSTIRESKGKEREDAIKELDSLLKPTKITYEDIDRYLEGKKRDITLMDMRVLREKDWKARRMIRSPLYASAELFLRQYRIPEKDLDRYTIFLTENSDVLSFLWINATNGYLPILYMGDVMSDLEGKLDTLRGKVERVEGTPEQQAAVLLRYLREAGKPRRELNRAKDIQMMLTEGTPSEKEEARSRVEKLLQNAILERQASQLKGYWQEAGRTKELSRITPVLRRATRGTPRGREDARAELERLLLHEIFRKELSDSGLYVTVPMFSNSFLHLLELKALENPQLQPGVKELIRTYSKDTDALLLFNSFSIPALKGERGEILYGKPEGLAELIVKVAGLRAQRDSKGSTRRQKEEAKDELERLDALDKTGRDLKMLDIARRQGFVASALLAELDPDLLLPENRGLVRLVNDENYSAKGRGLRQWIKDNKKNLRGGKLSEILRSLPAAGVSPNSLYEVVKGGRRGLLHQQRSIYADKGWWIGKVKVPEKVPPAVPEELGYPLRSMRFKAPVPLKEEKKITFTIKEITEEAPMEFLKLGVVVEVEFWEEDIEAGIKEGELLKRIKEEEWSKKVFSERFKKDPSKLYEFVFGEMWNSCKRVLELKKDEIRSPREMVELTSKEPMLSGAGLTIKKKEEGFEITFDYSDTALAGLRAWVIELLKKEG